MNPLGLSEEAIQAIVDTYRFFDVNYYVHSGEDFYYVKGYRRKLGYRFGEGDDLCLMDSISDAWALVYLLRACKSGRDLNQTLQLMGIQCPVPVSVIRKDGDSHG